MRAALHRRDSRRGTRPAVETARSPDDEVEGALAAPAHAHDELRVEDAVALVLRLAGEVELRREDAAAGRLHLDVDVARAAGVHRRHDRLQPPAPVGIGELVAAVAEGAVVVVTLLVRVPEVEQRALERLA